MKALIERLKNGILNENAVFVQVLGMCPTLGVTTSANDGLGMGLATTAVLMCSNLLISLLKSIIPGKIRIPTFIVIIATFVTLVEFSLKAYLPDLNKQLGLFIPLIVVNCVILGRAEAYASKNSIGKSLFDGLGVGLGFTLSLALIGAVRELFGNGTVFGLNIMPKIYEPAIIMILAPGAFFVMGILLAIINYIRNKRTA